MRNIFYFIRYSDGMNGRSFERLTTARRWLARQKYSDTSVRIFANLGGGYIMDVTEKR